MINPISEFSNKGDQLLDTCDGTLATAKPIFQLSENLRFVVSGKYSSCVQNRLRSLPKLLAGPALSLKSDKARREEGVEASNVLLNKNATLLTMIKIDGYTVPLGLNSV